MSVKFSLATLREGICSYNNLEREPISCLCNQLPLSNEFDEPEYRVALGTKGHVEIFGFLCEWNMMPTPLLMRYRIRKPSQLREKIKPVQDEVKTLRDINLQNIPLKNDDRTRIIQIFGNLSRAIGPVCASKVLHILEPDLFIPWDNAIWQDYALGSSPQDYITFLERCKNELDLVLIESQSGTDDLRRMFYQNGWKPVTKLLDEIHWAYVRRLPPHFEKGRNER